MQIFVKLMSGTIVTITAEPNNTIYQIKLKLKELGLDSTFATLSFYGRSLKNQYTLNYYNIQKDSTIHLINICRGGMHHEVSSRPYFSEDKPFVYINNEEKNEVIGINADFNESILNLKLQLQIHENIDIPVSKQNLIYNNSELINFKSLNDSGITYGSSLILRRR